MKKELTLTALLLVLFQTTFAQIPVEQYRQEINNLKDKNAIKAYWQRLMDVDQKAVNDKVDLAIGDSIFVDNMIQITLLTNILAEKSAVQNITNVLPAITLIHNQSSQSNLAFWPVLQKIHKNYMPLFSYPSYLLEGEMLEFYNYSMFGKDEQYAAVIAKLDAVTNQDKDVIANLLEAYEHSKVLRKLTTQKVWHTWYVDEGLGTINKEETFSFREMSDGHLYISNRSNLQRLYKISSQKDVTLYRIANEPLGWTYRYTKKGGLSLLDEEEKVLLTYTLVDE